MRFDNVDKVSRILQLKNFNTLLSYYDQRLRKSLDAGYLKEEWRFGGPRSAAVQGQIDIPGTSGRDMPPVHTHNRINMVSGDVLQYIKEIVYKLIS